MNTYTYVLPEIKREAIDTAAKSSSSEGPALGRTLDGSIGCAPAIPGCSCRDRA